MFGYTRALLGLISAHIRDGHGGGKTIRYAKIGLQMMRSSLWQLFFFGGGRRAVDIGPTLGRTVDPKPLSCPAPLQALERQPG